MGDAILPSSLSYFVGIAETGSLTAAARRLGISQPSLSVALKKLEEELKTTLFIRGRRGVVLTHTGEVLLRHARHTLRTLDVARQEIEGLESEPRGHFSIGCHESLAAYFLPGFMGRFLERYPGIQLSLWNGNSRDVERAVLEREVDIGLVVNPQGHPDCVVTPLFHDRVELIVASSLGRRARKTPAALLETHPLVFVPAIRQAQYIVAALHQKGQSPRQLTCSSMELVKSLVLDGVGTGILPYRVATHGVASGRLRPLGAGFPFFEDTIALVRRYDGHVTAAARLLLDGLREHGEKMPEVPTRGGRRGSPAALRN